MDTTTIKHLTPGRTGYARGCRCDACRLPHNEHYRRYQAERRRRQGSPKRVERAASEYFPVDALFRITGLSGMAMAARVGVARETLCRAVKRGGLTWAMADECAVRLGYHPGEVWPEWWTA